MHIHTKGKDCCENFANTHKQICLLFSIIFVNENVKFQIALTL